jgi:hypothetical protein
MAGLGENGPVIVEGRHQRTCIQEPPPYGDVLDYPCSSALRAKSGSPTSRIRANQLSATYTEVIACQFVQFDQRSRTVLGEMPER